MDTLNIPMLIRQKRLGHADINTTMRYTHTVTEEERRVSEQLGNYLGLESAPKATVLNPGFPKSADSGLPNRCK